MVIQEENQFKRLARRKQPLEEPSTGEPLDDTSTKSH